MWKSMRSTFTRNSICTIRQRIPYSTKLTSLSYPHVKKNQNFKQIDENDLNFFRSILSPNEVVFASKDNNQLQQFNQDWMHKYLGQSKLLLQPDSVNKVSQILKYCNDAMIPVVPQGGNTDLVGASVPVFDELILSIANLNKIRSFDPVSGILRCDAGVILENCDDFLRKNNHIFPIDLGAKGSCHVGGCIATNAGGLRLLRYGSLHGSVLGLEVVLPNGELYSNVNALRKDNTGYDLKQLFIGSEGTIGIITGCSILTPSAPKSVNVCFLALDSFDMIEKLFVKAKSELSEILSAFEFMDKDALSFAAKILPDTPFPLEENNSAFYVLIETSGSNNEHDSAKLDAFLENAMEDGLVADGTIAQGELESVNLWKWREMIPEACQAVGGIYKFDVSLPFKDIYALVDATNAKLIKDGLINPNVKSSPAVRAVGYGHIGDGNLHLNVAVREYSKAIEDSLEPFVYEFVQSKKGSISAEHGLGFHKKNFIQYSKTPIEIKMMKQIKKLYDPKGILNPYKYI